MRPRLLAVLIALLGSLSLAVPAAWAAPNFGGASIEPIVFATSPGSSCHPQLTNSVTLPPATGTGTISYAIANLPPGVTLDDTTGVLTGAIETVTAQAARTYTYVATDAADSRTASLTFTLEVVDEKAILQTFYNETDGPNWTRQGGIAYGSPSSWVDIALPTTCLDDLEGVSLHRIADLGRGTVGRVSSLQLPRNNLTGRLPAELGKLTNLIELLLDNNQLSGEIPRELGNLTSLTQVQLHNNQLSGSIPTTIGNLTNLWQIHLYNNQLSGSIPATIGQLTGLTDLRLYDNQLSGSIPATIGNLTKLPILHLRNNQLSGRIPPEIGDLTGLGEIDLRNNQLSGRIPPEIGDLTNLTNLLLDNNQLTGTIPTKLTDPSDPTSRVIALPASLIRLYLRQNRLSGKIPPEIGTLPSLRFLLLNHNELSGEIPPEIGDLTSLGYLYLHNNRLSGEIPPEIGDLTGLLFLYLNNNQLSGEIPDEIGALTRLRYLSLHSNAGLYNYPSSLDAKSGLYLLAPDDGAAMCLPTTSGGTDCTIPTKVDQLRLRPSYGQIEASWQPQAGSTPGGYELEYITGRSWISVPLSPATATTATIPNLPPGQRYDVRVRTTDTPPPPGCWPKSPRPLSVITPTRCRWRPARDGRRRAPRCG